MEVNYNGTWGRICDVKWEIRDAHVVCRQLGFRYALNAHQNARYGQGTGPIFMSGVSCMGNESSLFSCWHIGVENYQKKCYYKDVSVRCVETEGKNN